MNSQGTLNVIEKRSVQRFDLGLNAVIYRSDDSSKPVALAGRTRDVSANGTFLLLDNPLPVGTKVKVEMILSLDELKKLGGKALIKTSGEVLRTEIEGMALSFDRGSRITPFSSITSGSIASPDNSIHSRAE